MTVTPDTIVVHEIKETDLRSVFTREATVFTPWLAKPENLDRLARAVGMRLEPLAPGAVLEVLADDPAAAVDMPHFCAEAGHGLIGQEPAGGGATRYRIRKGG